VTGCIPGGRIAAKVGKFTRIGGKAVKFGFKIGSKAVDLAIVGRSIKTAADTGEPLAIYQAFLASGMSVKDSYDITRNMSSALKLGRTIEESTSLEELEALQNEAPEYSIAEPVQRTFRVGSREMLGRAVNGEIEIFSENTRTWEKGSKLHLLAFRLQNAGGERRLSALFRNEIVIGKHTFKRVKYSQDKLNEMMRIAQAYAPVSDSTARIAKIQQDYRAGKEMSHAPQYDRYNSLSLDKKLDVFNNPDTNAFTRGVLAGKINEAIENINLYEAAKAADDWKASANKATDVVLVPQGIFLKGQAGECLPESILMGRALQSGQDSRLAKKLMSIYLSPNVADDPLYKSLVRLHADGNASKFSAAAIPDVNVSALDDAESRLFPTENSSVRVDIPGHTILMSRVNREGKVKYVFYDPNYGLAYFSRYKDMCAFFKKKIRLYDMPESSFSFCHLDYSHLPDVKINERNLDEIIDDEIPPLYNQERVNFQGNSEASTTFDSTIFRQVLTKFLNQQTAHDPGDPDYMSYLSAFNSLPESKKITLQQVKDLKHALYASGDDLEARAKYQYALLAYLSGQEGIKLPVDTNEIRVRIEQERDHAEYVYGWKVKERDRFWAELNKKMTELPKIKSPLQLPCELK